MTAPEADATDAELVRLLTREALTPREEALVRAIRHLSHAVNVQIAGFNSPRAKQARDALVEAEVLLMGISPVLGFGEPE